MVLSTNVLYQYKFLAHFEYSLFKPGCVVNALLFIPLGGRLKACNVIGIYVHALKACRFKA